MTLQRAIKLAIECLEKEIHKSAFDASMYDLKLATYGYSQKASKKRKQLKKAIEVLNAEIN